ncbi:MAG: hypothetical protein COA30_03905 [Sulfurimonas sp.]|nr:MAG: hypothetical protein COA30_03905 [Sulfurimonas sp.]
MKATKIIVSLAVMGTLTLGFTAEDATETTDTQVSTEQRVEQMNEMKVKLMNMAPSDRQTAMQDIQADMPADMKEQMEVRMEQMQEKVSQMQTSSDQSQNHALEMQAEHSQELSAYQTMNQNQVAQEIKHEISSGRMSTDDVRDIMSR